jgi:hypothetical protein
MRKHFLAISSAVLLLTFTASFIPGGDKPTKADITKAMKIKWEKAASSLNPKVTIDISEILMGSSAKANYAQELQGIPKGVTVTTAKIDFTENSFYTTETQKVRRITKAWIYRDEFKQWAIMNTATTYPGN